MNFEPFDNEYEYKGKVLTEDFPDYLLPSITNWITRVLNRRSYIQFYSGKQYINRDSFILPLNETLRLNFSSDYNRFLIEITRNSKILRNVLSYLLQKECLPGEARKLESILTRTGSAYAVQINEFTENSSSIKRYQMKLVYRVNAITAQQAAPVLNNSDLIQEAWDNYYGLRPDYEKTVTRCSDALAGILKEKSYPEEKKPQLGKLLNQLLNNPDKIKIPGESVMLKKHYLELMQQFPAIRGDHRTGTGRAPTKEEAKFVLHYTIMFYQLTELG